MGRLQFSWDPVPKDPSVCVSHCPLIIGMCPSCQVHRVGGWLVTKWTCKNAEVWMELMCAQVSAFALRLGGMSVCVMDL